jgi:hypothetical protein
LTASKAIGEIGLALLLRRELTRITASNIRVDNQRGSYEMAVSSGAASDEGWTVSLRIESQDLRRLLPTAFMNCSYSQPNIEDSTRTATATRGIQDQGYFRTTSQIQASIRWEAGQQNTGTRVICAVYETSRGQRTHVQSKSRELGESLSYIVDSWLRNQPERNRDAPPYDPIVKPGERFERAYAGTLRDYSGCAAQWEALDLARGILPIGRYHFGSEEPPRDAPPLYLSRFRNGSRIEFNGVLICAPQNSGKTRLILRWAEAATHAESPYSVFIIDVKGNMRQKLAGRLKGEIYCFSTNPDETDTDRINFLAGPTGLDAAESDRIRQFSTALLPSRGHIEAGGRDEYHYRNNVTWLTAFIHLLKLAQCYRPEWFLDDKGGERDVDLCDLYELIADERRVYEWIRYLREDEVTIANRGDSLPVCGIDHWVSELAIMLSPAGVDIGQRSERYSFREYTASILSALEPFSAHGTLHARVRSFGAGRLFDFEETLGKAARPVTVILTARQQDLDKSSTVLSLAIKRLQWFLFDRMSQEDAEERPVLLLLDETRRIRDFDAAEYVTFAREAKAACVVVYQSLDQAGPPAKVTELLENVGTQIYLGSLVGATARHFLGILPERSRTSISRQVTKATNTETETITISRSEVGYFTTAELYDLPAGQWPALVYINDQPRRKPILTSMVEPAEPPPVDTGAALELLGSRPQLRRRSRPGEPAAEADGQ